MFSLIKKVVLCIINQECKVRKIIIVNHYMTFPHKIGIDKCI